MVLITYSFEQEQNFQSLQQYFLDSFGQSYQKLCHNFMHSGHSDTEVAFLFVNNELRIFYSIPRYDEFDIISFNETCNVKEFMLKLLELLSGDATITAHISYDGTYACPKKYLLLYLPPEYKTDDSDTLECLLNEDRTISCSLYTAPHISKEIQFVLNTYDDIQSSIINTIDGSQKDNFLPRFFSLVSLFMYGR